MVDDTQNSLIKLGPAQDLSGVKENMRYQPKKTLKLRGLSLPVKQTKKDQLKKFAQEPIRFPTKVKESSKKRQKSMIVITERFLNTKGTENMMDEHQVDHSIGKRHSNVSTSVGRSYARTVSKNRNISGHFEPYRNKSETNRYKSPFLATFDDTTPQKVASSKY